jgi:hypothetical protein
MTRYIPAFSWPQYIEDFVRAELTERPILNVCCGDSPLGDVRMDVEILAGFFPADVRGDMAALPFKDDTFAAIFSDPPWDSTMKAKCAAFCKEAMRVAPVLYLMAPWIWGTHEAQLEKCWVRQHPGINAPIFVSKYRRRDVPEQGEPRQGE